MYGDLELNYIATNAERLTRLETICEQVATKQDLADFKAEMAQLQTRMGRWGVWPGCLSP